MVQKKYRWAFVGGGIFLLCLAGGLFYIKRMIPPGEEWISWRNEELIASIDRQLDGIDIERLAADKDKYILEKSVAELQQAVRSGSLTYEDITAICLYRIKTIDQKKHGTNSVMEVAPDAMEQARACDRKRVEMAENGEQISGSSLFGIPVMLKDNINTSDMPTSGGAAALADFIPSTDAELVRTLRKRGAVILGKNNLSEFAYFVSSVMPSGYSGKKGQTINPYGPLKLSPSGSSSGSAVAVTENLTPISIGTETAGSIAGPASANSVVGFKPSRGKISGEGIMPLIKKVDAAGPITKCVEDAAAAYAAMTGERVEDLDKTALNGAVIGLVSYEYDDDVVVGRLKSALEEMGARVVEVDLNMEGVQVQNIIPYTFKQDFEKYADQYGLPVTDLGDLIAFNREDSRRRARYGQDCLEAAEAAETDPSLIDTSIKSAKNSLHKLFEEQGLDAVVYLKASASTIVAAAGYPQLTVPFGRDKKGAPVGVTFASQYGQDRKLLDLGYAFERAAAGRILP